MEVKRGDRLWMLSETLKKRENSKINVDGGIAGLRLSYLLRLH